MVDYRDGNTIAAERRAKADAAESEARIVAQIAASLADGYVRDGGHLDLSGQTELVRMAEFLLAHARERVAAKA